MSGLLGMKGKPTPSWADEGAMMLSNSPARVWTLQRRHTKLSFLLSDVLTQGRWCHSEQFEHLIVGMDSLSAKKVSTNITKKRKNGHARAGPTDLPSQPQIQANISASFTTSLQTGHISCGMGVRWEMIALRAMSGVNVISIQLYPGHQWAVFVV